MPRLEIPPIDNPVRTFRRNRDLYHQGDSAHRLLIVRSGSIFTSTNLNDNLSANLVMAPGVVGFEALLGRSVYESTARTYSNSQIQFFDVDELKSLRVYSPKFINTLLMIGVDQYLTMMNRFAVRQNGVSAAVANLLLEYSMEINSNTLVNGLVDRDLASLSGITRESTNKAIRRMVRQGIIKRNSRRSLELLDCDKLHKIVAQGEKFPGNEARNGIIGFSPKSLSQRYAIPTT